MPFNYESLWNMFTNKEGKKKKFNINRYYKK